VSEQNVTLVLSNKITVYIHEAYDIYVYMYSRKSMITVTLARIPRMIWCSKRDT
jgi:uncharacterized membrane protein YcgQ (UPF0703/DUF1980 family)